METISEDSGPAVDPRKTAGSIVVVAILVAAIFGEVWLVKQAIGGLAALIRWIS